MNIIQKQPNTSGAYPPIQSWSGETIPDTVFETYYEVADGVKLSCGGFGTLTVDDNIVTAFTPDETAWTLWQTENSPPTPQPTTEERLAATEAAITALMGV